MKTKDQGFGEGYRSMNQFKIQNKCFTPLYPYTLTPGLNRKSGCVSPILKSLVSEHP